MKKEGEEQKKQKQERKGRKKTTYILQVVLLLGVMAAPFFWRYRDKIHWDFGIVLKDIRDLFASNNSKPLTQEEIDLMTESEKKYHEDPYASVTRELKEDGEEITLEFGPGRYLVGGHIPEGTYRISGSEVCDSEIDVKDMENKIDHHWWIQYDAEQGDSGLYIEDIRLYNGAEVMVRGSEKLVFYTENGQPEEMKSGEENPLTKEVEFVEMEMCAGEDFEPGVYDIVVKEGGGSVGVTWAEDYEKYYMTVSGKEYYTDRACNLELTEGTRIAQSDIDLMNARIVLVPSEKIFPQE